MDVCDLSECGDEVWEYAFEDNAGYVLCDAFLEEFGFGEAFLEECCGGAFLGSEGCASE